MKYQPNGLPTAETLAARARRVDSDKEGQHLNRLMKLQADIDALELMIEMANRSDNFYYTSGRRDADLAELKRIKCLFEEAQTEFAAERV